MAIPKLNGKGRMADIPPSPEVKMTVERRGEIVLIGVGPGSTTASTPAPSSAWPGRTAEAEGRPPAYQGK